MKKSELIKFLDDIDDDFDIILLLCIKVPEDELKERIYQYPYDMFKLEVETGDIGHSNKEAQLVSYIHKNEII